MKVKRYVAPTMPDAMQKIKAELGMDAVILHTRQLRQGGIFGLFGKRMVEVTAAVEEDRQPKPSSRPIPPSPPAVEIPEESVTQTSGKVFEDRFSSLHAELKETKALMRQMLDVVEPIHLSDPALPPTAKRLWKRLVDNDVDPDLAIELLNGILSETSDIGSGPEADDLECRLQRQILTLMEKAQVTQPDSGKRPTIISLIGPTGVGKTTTIAKLAARSALIERQKVGLVTIDTYRIAAVEQLKTYARILGIPVEVVFTPQELQETLGRMQDLDCIFIDTAGRSHHNAIQMAELHRFFELISPDITYLVLSMTTKYRDLMDIIVSYETLHPQGLVLTKLDETETYGSIFNVVTLLQKQLAYITHGQNVPDDIESFDPSYLTNLIMGNKNARSS